MSPPFPTAPCPRCAFALPAGARACPRCGLAFTSPVESAPLLPAAPAGGPAAAAPPALAAPAAGAVGPPKARALAVVVVVLVLIVGAGAAAYYTIGDGAVGDCVLRYQYEGVVRHSGWTQGECNQWCADNVEPNGRALECWFE